MAKQEIRDFPDFEGESTEGYIIVGGKTASVEGGKKLLSDVIPNVPAADEETITNDNGTLKVKEPVPPHEEHDNALLCVDWDGEVKWTDDLEDPISVEEVWKSICATKKLEKFTNYPLEINASGGVALITNENTQIGAVLTVVPNDSDEQSFDWVLPPEQVQADWEQDDSTKKDYIKNKPDIPKPDNYKIIKNEQGELTVKTIEVSDIDDCFYSGFPIYYESSSGGFDINIDDTLIKIKNKDSEGYITSTDLSVAVPVPDPNPSEGSQADDGSVLTYNANSDEIVWAAPQGGGGTTLPDTTTANAGDVLTLDNNKGLSWSAPQGGGSLPTKVYCKLVSGNVLIYSDSSLQNSLTPQQVFDMYNNNNNMLIIITDWDNLILYPSTLHSPYDVTFTAIYRNRDENVFAAVCIKVDAWNEEFSYEYDIINEGGGGGGS